MSERFGKLEEEKNSRSPSDANAAGDEDGAKYVWSDDDEDSTDDYEAKRCHYQQQDRMAQSPLLGWQLDGGGLAWNVCDLGRCFDFCKEELMEFLEEQEEDLREGNGPQQQLMLSVEEESSLSLCKSRLVSTSVAVAGYNSIMIDLKIINFL